MTEVTSTKELALQEALDFASRCGQKSDSWTAQARPRRARGDGKWWEELEKLCETVRNCEKLWSQLEILDNVQDFSSELQSQFKIQCKICKIIFESEIVELLSHRWTFRSWKTHSRWSRLIQRRWIVDRGRSYRKNMEKPAWVWWKYDNLKQAHEIYWQKGLNSFNPHVIVIPHIWPCFPVLPLPDSTLTIPFTKTGRVLDVLAGIEMLRLEDVGNSWLRSSWLASRRDGLTWLDGLTCPVTAEPLWRPMAVHVAHSWPWAWQEQCHFSSRVAVETGCNG